MGLSTLLPFRGFDKSFAVYDQEIALLGVTPGELACQEEAESEFAFPEVGPPKGKLRFGFRCRWLMSRCGVDVALGRIFGRAFLGLILFLGFLKLIGLSWGFFVFLYPDDLDERLDAWGFPDGHPPGISHWTTNGVISVGCHSHNDYWRNVPLRSAIDAGCIGVEADVWLFKEELFVGHTVFSLDEDRTLRSLYINPLLDFLNKRNAPSLFQEPGTIAGVFTEDPSQTLVLLIDYKTSGKELWPHVHSQLEPLRNAGFLTYFDGQNIVPRPITVVATGNAPLDMVLSNSTHRDIFYDAPLDEMIDESKSVYSLPPIPNSTDPTEENGKAEEGKEAGKTWHRPGGGGSSKLEDTTTGSVSQQAAATAPAINSNNIQTHTNHIQNNTTNSNSNNNNNTHSHSIYDNTNSYYASVNFRKAIGKLHRNRFSPTQLGLIRAQIRAAHDRGLKVRYWGTPGWPRGLRNHVWHILLREGVDVLNVDDLRDATRRDWRKHQSWWS